MNNANPYWFYFQHTGQIEAYLTYIEYRRLTSNEFSEDFDRIQKERYERNYLRTDSSGDGLSGE